MIRWDVDQQAVDGISDALTFLTPIVVDPNDNPTAPKSVNSDDAHTDPVPFRTPSRVIIGLLDLQKFECTHS